MSRQGNRTPDIDLGADGAVRPLDVTMTFALNAEDDPTPLVIPAVQALAEAKLT